MPNQRLPEPGQQNPQGPQGSGPNPQGPGPNPQGQGPLGPQLSPGGQEQFKSIRRFVLAAQICALVSLIIGGVVLSTVGLVLGLVARSKANAMAAVTPEAERTGWLLLRRSATIGTVMAAVALVLNAVSMAIMMPAMMQMLQSGDYGALVQGGSVSGSVWN